MRADGRKAVRSATTKFPWHHHRLTPPTARRGSNVLQCAPRSHWLPAAVGDESTASLGKEGAEPVQRPGVDHLVGRHPATLGDGDAVADVIQMWDRVGIGVDREDNSMFSGTAHKFVVEVEPVGEGVDFQGGVGARGSCEHGVNVEVNWRTPTEETGSRTADDVDVRVLDGGEEAPGHRLAGVVEIGVQGSNQDVEPGEEVVIPIKRTVGRRR